MAKGEKSKKPKKKIIAKILLILVAILLAGTAVFFGYKYYKLRHVYNNLLFSQSAYNDAHSKAIENNNQKTIKAVSKLIALPSNESPTIFEVSDKAKLGNAIITKTYFANAKNGDVILAYQKANLSVIYRPSEKRIIKSDNYTNFYAAANPIKIAIIAPQSQQQDTENLIGSKVINAEIISKQSPKTSNNQSFVVDATGQNAKAAKELADKIGFSVGQLPNGEEKPQGALLIVVIAASNSQPSQ